MPSLHNAKIWIAGHEGMVGAACARRLRAEGAGILTAPRAALDLRDQRETRVWLAAHRPDMVILAAARVGGIHANATQPADFLYDNLMIAANVIEAARQEKIRKLLFLGSSCIYPRAAAQPMAEEALLTGPLEPTNEAYAIAKIAGLRLCAAMRRQHGCDFISAMPCNLYGPGDRYDAAASHVIPALILKLHEAKIVGVPEVALWGTGAPLREFLYVDDLAGALALLLKEYSGEAPVNIGGGAEISIAALAALVAETVGYRGALRFDPAMPDGAPRKLLDSRRIAAMGWQPVTPLREGLRLAYADFLARRESRAAA